MRLYIGVHDRYWGRCAVAEDLRVGGRMRVILRVEKTAPKGVWKDTRIDATWMVADRDVEVSRSDPRGNSYVLGR